MRILQALHFYLPRHSAGTEVYTHGLASALSARGHEVHLFFTEKVLSRRNYELVERVQDGMRCHVMINNLLYDQFEQTFANGEVERTFERVLDRVRPDLVHFQHLMLLSLALPEIAARRGVPVVMTLHDFWLYCARFGQLMQHGEAVCRGPRPRKCAHCLGDFKYAQSSLQKKVISAIRWTRDVSGFDLAPVVDAWRGSRLASAAKLFRGAAKAGDKGADALPAVPAGLERQFSAREQAVRELIPHVDLFLAPSKTVRERMIRFGLPQRRVKLCPLGIQTLAVAERTPRAGREVRFGFIGTLSPHKGTHVAVAAMRYLKGRGELLVFGRRDYYPAYVASLRSLAQGLPVRFLGAVPRAEIGSAFSRIDVLVMPSVWLENFPIIIQEARAARVPVIASDIGGMREAVRDDIDGLLFQVGDAKDLARKMARLIAEPERIDALAERAIPPITLEEHVLAVERHLSEAVERQLKKHEGR